MLIHIPGADLPGCLTKLAAGVTPGGVIILEESSFASACADESSDKESRALYDVVLVHVHAFMRDAG